MTEIKEEHYYGERPLFMAKDLKIIDTVFDEGESPLKESHNIELVGSQFKWKYPLWYASDIVAKDTTWFEMARAGVWYSKNLDISGCVIQAPKNFRRSQNIKLTDVYLSNAAETLWNCDDVTLKNVRAKGDYFAMNTNNIQIEDFSLDGNYSFDGCKNVTVKNARLLSKDAFWNTENVTVYDSFISGEYLGWNAKNLTLINCTVESEQGMCYIDGIRMENCKLINTTLAFEFSSDIKADITTGIDSVMNPGSGYIKAESIKELILEKDKIDPEKTTITVRN